MNFTPSSQSLISPFVYKAAMYELEKSCDSVMPNISGENCSIFGFCINKEKEEGDVVEKLKLCI